MQPISQTTYNLNSELLVRYSSHVLNNELLFRYSSHDLKNKLFEEPTVLDHLNTKLVRYSDPHCSWYSDPHCTAIYLEGVSVIKSVRFLNHFFVFQVSQDLC